MIVRTAFLLVALAAAASPAPVPATDDPADPGVRKVLVLADGGRVEIAGEVGRRDGLVVYRTAEGTLASVPEDRVTAVEDAPLPVAPAAPARDDLPVPTFTDDDLPAPLLPVGIAGGTAGESGSPEPGTVAVVPPPWTYDGYVDRDGRDAAWWRARVAALEADRSAAEADLERWTRSYRELSALVELECADAPGGVSRRPSTCVDYLRSQSAAEREVEAARARLEAIDRERGGLSDEARRAGALPGWLR